MEGLSSYREGHKQRLGIVIDSSTFGEIVINSVIDQMQTKWEASNGS